jgi:hypothetical protein
MVKPKGRTVRVLSKALLAGAGASVPLAGLLAQPAGAALKFANVSEDFTFVRGGQEVTCTVVASSYVDYDSERDVTALQVHTRLDDGDPLCHDSIVATDATGLYQLSDGSTESLHSTSDSHTTLASLLRTGAVTSMTVRHNAYFLCDDGSQSSCMFEVNTSPK